ncbi:MAG: holo-ACP synthase [Cellulosilyticum sp.]|nr:holo-ACP synthase [Cellulosilyticum sp.]
MIIGIGTDIIEIHRIENAIGKTKSFFDKVYTDEEKAYYTKKHKKVETLAGLFAAKEAVSKALGTGFKSFGMRDIEVIPNNLGKPEVYLYGPAKELAEKMGISKVHMSISHCQTYATAFAIAEGGEISGIINTSSNARNR